MRPERPDRPGIWTQWTLWTIWMLPRMLPRRLPLLSGGSSSRRLLLRSIVAARFVNDPRQGAFEVTEFAVRDQWVDPGVSGQVLKHRVRPLPLADDWEDRHRRKSRNDRCEFVRNAGRAREVNDDH